jgi:hypothetical protein
MSAQRDDRRLIGRLLGSAEPEVSCEQCFEHLDAYVGIALVGGNPPPALPGLRAHLEGCPACEEDHRSLLAFAGRG